MLSSPPISPLTPSAHWSWKTGWRESASNVIGVTKRVAAEHGIARDRFEFQMLYGIRRDLQENLVKEGYPVRVYVPFGTHWYPYFMRRLAERPANIWFFISNFFRK